MVQSFARPSAIAFFSPRGVAVVEVREYLFLRKSAQSSEPPVLPDKKLAWRGSIDPDPVLLFHFSAVKSNSHRIHYDRDDAIKVEGFPGLVVPGTLVAQLFIEMCRRELPHATMTTFRYERTAHPIEKANGWRTLHPLSSYHCRIQEEF
jgi:3-methylfumaryl-CoA hydratase